jgi:hypothetical protein
MSAFIYIVRQVPDFYLYKSKPKEIRGCLSTKLRMFELESESNDWKNA